MGVYRDKHSGNYGIRFYYFEREFKKIIGPDPRNAKLALEEVKNEIRLSKLAGQRWEGFAKLQKATAQKTFAEASADFLAERANLKASSLASWQSILRQHLLPEFGKYSLCHISDTHLKKYQAALSRRVSESRTNTIMQVIRSILDAEYTRGGIERDPAKAVKRVQEPKVKINPLSEQDLKTALSAISSHYRPLFVVLAFTGARPNELLALRWSDIDWKNEQISITKGRVRGNEGLPKTKSSERNLPILPQVLSALRELEARPLKSHDGYVFVKPDGKPIDKHLDRVWANALKKAGLAHRPSYQLRHTFATQCIIKGFPIPYVAKLLGHSTSDTVIRHYLAWIDKETEGYEDKLKSAFAFTLLEEGTPQIAKQEGKPEGLQKVC